MRDTVYVTHILDEDELLDLIGIYTKDVDAEPIFEFLEAARAVTALTVRDAMRSSRWRRTSWGATSSRISSRVARTGQVGRRCVRVMREVLQRRHVHRGQPTVRRCRATLQGTDDALEAEADYNHKDIAPCRFIITSRVSVGGCTGRTMRVWPSSPGCYKVCMLALLLRVRLSRSLRWLTQNFVFESATVGALSMGSTLLALPDLRTAHREDLRHTVLCSGVVTVVIQSQCDIPGMHLH